MNIVIINPFGDSSGHSLNFSTRLTNSISTIDNTVNLFTSENYNPNSSIFGDIKFKIHRTDIKSTSKLNKNYSSLFSVLIYAKYRFLGSILVLRNAIKYVKKNRDVKIIHIIGGEPLSMLLFLFTLKSSIREKVILNIHNADYDLNLVNSFFKKIYKLILKVIYRKIYFKFFGFIVVHGYQMKEDFISRVKIKHKFHNRIFAINIGVENILSKSNSKLNRDEKSILFFGVLRKDKGLEYALEAISKVRKFNLTIAGYLKEYSENEILKLIKKYDLKNQVTLIPRFIDENEMDELFIRHKYLILPYKKSFAAQSVVLTLGAKYQNFIIGSDTGQNGYDIKKFNLGLTFEAENVNSLIKTLKSNQIDQEIKKEVYLNYFSFYSWQNIGKLYRKCYEKKQIQ